MRSFAILAGLSSLLLAHPAVSQLVTTTLPWANGNTEVLSVSTDALGDLLTVTISTITAAEDGAAATTALLTTALTTPLTTALATTNTRLDTTTTKRPTTTAGAPTSTTGLRVVGQETTAAPMQTTTYFYPNGAGPWTSATWSASVTGDPTVATAIIPQGSIQPYQEYQSAVNSVVLASAEAVASATTSQTGGARRNSIATGWAAAGVGAVGVVMGVMMI
ncbi:MAG: hypothetical protein TREMPRED_000899 [Tremellales sp. Tagirdzhanova-0007]|nr:MAG: hypothetical protein TREMPRED_000899 [Tremellales sp. Tagirdzhanova-0007]